MLILYVGCGYGSRSFPKDVKALMHTGMAFKPEIEDMRASLVLVIIEKLQNDGAAVYVFDPIDERKRRIGDSVT